MPKIAEEHPYNGARERVERLGLGSLLEELRGILSGFQLLVKEERDANGGAAVRRLLDDRFGKAKGWTKSQSGEAEEARAQG